jgi:Concanavalin A-like lectin/glucanases superfamily/Calcineurin-like phosphoesterase
MISLVILLLFSFLIISVAGLVGGQFFIPEVSAQGTFPNFNFAAVGDWDCGSNAVATSNSIINNNPELVLGLGDYSYEANANCWLNIIDSFDHKMKITIGNHEIDESSQSLGQYLNHFNMPRQYHSFNFHNIHFLVLATDDSFGTNSNQYSFAVNDLRETSSNPNIDWIVVVFHKPLYDVPCSSSSCDPENEFRDIYHPLFDQYGVDLALYGHAHNYVRTFPIQYDSSTPTSPIITSTNQNNYINPDGQIFVQSGAGGRSLRDLSGTESYNAFQSDSEFGILNIDVVNTNSNNLQLIGKFIQNDGDVIDQFTISKQVTNPPPPPPAPEICNNGIDDDGDGLVDTADPDCQTPEVCNDNRDNDGDGLVDTADPDCQTTSGYHYAPFFTATGSNKLDVPDASNLRLSSFTVATWFKTTANFPSAGGIMVNKGGIGSESAGVNQNYGLWFTPSETLQGGFETTGGTNRYVTSTNTYNDGQWHHGVVTFDNSNNIVRIFVDGVQVRTLSTTSNPDNTGSQPLRIGGNAQSLTEGFFSGQLDEVGIWNRALTNSEIINLMNTGLFSSSGLVYSNSFGTSSSEVCDDNRDNDGDGLVDIADPDCQTPEVCDDNRDNDGDGLVDIADPDCQTTTGYHYSPSLTVNSLNDVVSIPSAQNLKLSKFSVANWFKTTSNFGDESFMVNKGGIGKDSSGNNMNYGIWMTSSEKVQGGFETSSGSDRFITSTNSYNDGQWHHGVVTFDGSILRLYIDGVQIITSSTSSTPETVGNHPLKIGANSRTADDIFTGSLDEVGVWSRALTTTEITNLMNNGIFSTTNGLVYYNSFNSQ